MKKSCLAKEFKVVTTEDAENALTVSKGSKEQLTDEQLLINQKLLESGIEDEGLGWLEKRNIFKTINVSLDTAGSENLQRSSSRLTKLTNSKPAKWIENSFETPKSEHVHNEKNLKTKLNKKELECITSRKLTFQNSNKRLYQELEESVLATNHKVEKSSCDILQKDGGSNCDSSKPKNVHYIKIEVEEDSKEECNLVSEKNCQSVSLGKKRACQPEIKPIEAPKKLKMDETNNGVLSEEEIPLKIELEMEKRKHNAPSKLRDIKSIVSECEIRNKKWKETFLKYKSPTRWGIPIVKNCNEKWDGKQIPPKLLHRYQKYLTSKNLTHPIFLPVKSQSSLDINRLNSENSLQLSTSSNSEFRDNSESDIKNLSEELICTSSNKTDGENNLNESTSGKDDTERMVLRNRSQQKTVISDEEEFSSDDSDDWLVKQKSSKKQKVNTKNKKTSDQSNKQLVLKLERFNINKGNGNEGGRKNGSKNDVNCIGRSAVSSNTLNQTGPDPDTMVCPICSLRFKKQHIESHATECASKTFKD